MVLTGCEVLAHSSSMFERFTNLARHVIVLAQEEARGLEHNYIGTEHLLLGLLGESSGLAAEALNRFGISLAQAREEVEARVGRGKKPPSGHIPFTPRSKKVLELALREALELHHDYIGTEHLLLGLVREGEGVGAQVLRLHADDLLAVRLAVLDVASRAATGPRRRWARRPTEPGGTAEEELRTTPAAEITLDSAARLARSQPIGSHHLLLAMLDDPNSAAARTLAASGFDLNRAKEALQRADVAGTSDEEPAEAGRRQMVIRVAEDRLTLEATDPALVGLGRAALAAVRNQADPAGGPDLPDAIHGDLPVSTSLGNVWLALKDSLEDIDRRATPHAPGKSPGAPGRRRARSRPQSP
jgi:ATP-dependent Clp protease ATP-binding subunit ClpC